MNRGFEENWKKNCSLSLYLVVLCRGYLLLSCLRWELYEMMLEDVLNRDVYLKCSLSVEKRCFNVWKKRRRRRRRVASVCKMISNGLSKFIKIIMDFF
jgi:hypothetical protein